MDLLPEDFLSGKMDRFAGSGPRLFISFRLDNEELGQPTSCHTEAMNVTTPDPAIVNYCSSSTSSLSETSDLPVLPALTSDKEVEADLVPEGPPSLTQPAEEMQTSEQATEVPPNTAQGTVTATVAFLVAYASGNTSEESCGAYFDRQVVLIEEARYYEAVAAIGVNPNRVPAKPFWSTPRCRKALKITLSLETPSDSSMEIKSVRPASPQSPSPTLSFRFSPPVQFLKARCKPIHYSTGHRGYKPKNPDSKVTIADTVTVQHTMGDQVDEPATSSIQVQTPRKTVRPTRTSLEPRNSSSSDAGEEPGSGVNSEVYARSTMEDALTSPKKHPRGRLGETSSDTSRSSSPVRESGTGPLTSSSRALIKQHFSEASPVFLPRGHPTVAFDEGQVSSILTAVANESARASFDMLSSVVERAALTWVGVLAVISHVVSATKGSLLLTTDSGRTVLKESFQSLGLVSLVTFPKATAQPAQAQ